jgi:glutathione-regulated potassium-efflux system protein KefB
MAQQHVIDLLPVLTLLGAGVVGGPLFKRLGLGSVLGYIAGGIVIGPFALGLFADPAAILQVAELGIVMFLFAVGLEMRPSRLWSMRREIFGLGFAQVSLCTAALTGMGIALGLPPAKAFVAGAGFVLTSTPIVMQMLDERGRRGSPAGQKIVAVLLLEDLMIVPLLAMVSLLAPAAGDDAPRAGFDVLAVTMAAAALAGVIIAGR